MFPTPNAPEPDRQPGAVGRAVISLETARSRVLDQLIRQQDELATSLSSAEAHATCDERRLLRALQRVEEAIENVNPEVFARLQLSWIASELARDHQPGEAADWCTRCQRDPEPRVVPAAA